MLTLSNVQCSMTSGVINRWLNVNSLKSNEGNSPTLAFKRAACPINNHTKRTNLSKPLGCSVVSHVKERLRNQLTAKANLASLIFFLPNRNRGRLRGKEHLGTHRKWGIHSVNGDWHSSQDYTTAHSHCACSSTYIIHSLFRTHL